MYGSAEGDQFIMVMPDKEILFNARHNGIYYHNL